MHMHIKKEIMHKIMHARFKNDSGSACPCRLFGTPVTGYRVRSTWPWPWWMTIDGTCSLTVIQN